MKLAILNTSIITADGQFSLETISLEEAQKLVKENKNDLLSAIGHQSTAEILTYLLGFDIPMNRIVFKQEPLQSAIVFKLNGRPPEGRILTREEIDTIGYEFKLLKRTR